MTPMISTEEASYRKHVAVLDTNMAYVDVGEGDPIVFLHGNPTPSYLWRNIIPHLLPYGRCLAPDYVGMGNSGPAPDGGYRFVDHRRYLDAWFEAMGLTSKVILIVHDWGSALGFDWARRNPERVAAIAYMEGIVRPFRSWDEWPEVSRAFFQGQRTDRGEDLILRQNLFIEYLLPLRKIPEEAIEVYRRYYRNPGPSRMPMLAWTRDLPIAGEPADVTAIVEDYAQWLSTSSIPKLFIDADPGGFLVGGPRERRISETLHFWSRTHQKRSTRPAGPQSPMRGAKLRSTRRHRACGSDGLYWITEDSGFAPSVPMQARGAAAAMAAPVAIAPGEDTFRVRVTVGFDIAR